MNRRWIRTGCTAAVLLLASCAGTAATTTNRPTVPPLPSSAGAPYIAAGGIPATAAPAAGLIHPESVDNSDPRAVALAAVLTLHRWDTRIDTTPTGAARRAAPWLTPALAAGLAAVPSHSHSTWLDLETHDGYTDLTTTIADEYGQPPNTASAAHVQVSYTVTLHGRDGWTKIQPVALSRTELRRTDDASPWLVSQFVS